MTTMIQGRSFWDVRGRLDRAPFVALGVSLVLAKFTIDSLVALLVFGRGWSPFNYWPSAQAGLWLNLTREDHTFAVVMLSLTLPFVWIGVALTVQRLRAAALPLWLSFLFFAPVVNFLFFALLAAIPSRHDADETPMAETESFPGPTWAARSGVSAAVTVPLGWILVYFNTMALGVYGLGLFVALPFSLGAVAALVYGRGGVPTRNGCVAAALQNVSLVAAALFLTSLEGVLCLLMAAPIWLVCAALGGVVGHCVVSHARNQRRAAILAAVLLITLPALLGAEFLTAPDPPTYVVRSAVEIDAPPSAVWPNVVSFPDLPDPAQWLFRTGLAFPLGAAIDGQGSGAVRRCRFSTGDFLEPIRIWDQPQLLAFDVIQNPPPMREWSWFDEIHPPHLHGFLVSQAGEFRLVALPGDRTRLEGATWYRHGMWPAAYWRLWSDAFIHTIHLRVLHHVRNLSEAQPPAVPPPGPG